METEIHGGSMGCQRFPSWGGVLSRRMFAPKNDHGIPQEGTDFLIDFRLHSFRGFQAFK